MKNGQKVSRKNGKVVSLPLRKISMDGETQARVAFDEETQQEYAAALRAGDKFPPLQVVWDKKTYWLWDGFHTLLGAMDAGLTSLFCEVTDGTLDDARWLSTGANTTHGLKRTNADKRNAVEMALKLRPTTSNSALANHCGVDEGTVRSARERLESASEIPKVTERTGTDGKTYDTTNIGKPKGEESAGEESSADGDSAPQETPDNPPSTLKPKVGKKVKPPEPAVKDALGNDVPLLVRDHFADRTLPEVLETVRGWLDQLNWPSLLNKIKPKVRAFLFLRIEDLGRHLDEAHDSLNAAVETVEAGMPYAVCVRCEGKGCEACRTTGYLPKWRYDELRQEVGT